MADAATCTVAQQVVLEGQADVLLVVDATELDQLGEFAVVAFFARETKHEVPIGVEAVATVSRAPYLGHVGTFQQSGLMGTKRNTPAGTAKMPKVVSRQ